MHPPQNSKSGNHKKISIRYSIMFPPSPPQSSNICQKSKLTSSAPQQLLNRSYLTLRLWPSPTASNMRVDAVLHSWHIRYKNSVEVMGTIERVNRTECQASPHMSCRLSLSSPQHYLHKTSLFSLPFFKKIWWRRSHVYLKTDSNPTALPVFWVITTT